MEQLKSAFSLEIKKESLQERVKGTLIIACFFEFAVYRSCLVFWKSKNVFGAPIIIVAIFLTDACFLDLSLAWI